MSVAALQQALQGQPPHSSSVPESLTPPGPQARLLLVDCRYDLADRNAGARAFAEGHLPGAVYAHLDDDLSGPTNGRNGRHPLPDRDALALRLRRWGADDDTLIVACDSSGGIWAARLWWLLRWLGHERVAVLDGGLPAWREAGGAWQPGTAAAPHDQPRQGQGADQAVRDGGFSVRPPLQATIGYAALRATLGQPPQLIVDARAPDRFAGLNETLDPVGGHIPGALNRHFRLNLDADGRCFKPAAQLRAEWCALLGDRQPEDAVMQCGSGVTACHHLLALAVCGLQGARLYPGSWSEWCVQPQAPVAVC